MADGVSDPRDVETVLQDARFQCYRENIYGALEVVRHLLKGPGDTSEPFGVVSGTPVRTPRCPGWLYAARFDARLTGAIPRAIAGVLWIGVRHAAPLRSMEAM